MKNHVLRAVGLGVFGMGLVSAALVACVSDDNVAPSPVDSGSPKNDATTPFDGSTHDSSTPGDDSSTDAPADSPTDTALPPACDLTKPFGTLALVDYPLGLDDYMARPTADLLTMYLMSNRNGGYHQLFTLTRASTSAAFANPTLIPNVNFAGSNTAKPSVTADGLTLYLESDTDGDAGQGAAARIYVTTRATAGGTFATPQLLDLGNSNSSDFAPFITPDGTTLYFSSDRTNFDGFVATRTGDAGTFGTPTDLTTIDSPGQITLNLVPSLDGLTIYFTSSRAADAAHVSNDVWVAHRASTSVAFDAPTNVVELNTDGNDEPSWLSPDGCTIWYASSGVPADAGPNDQRAHIYQATKPQ